MRQFYSHLIEVESIVVELDKLDLNDEQKHHLASLVDSSIHHTILSAILSELTGQDKKVFMQHLNEDDHQKIWHFLNEKIDGIEDKIKIAAEDLKKELHSDLSEAHKRK